MRACGLVRSIAIDRSYSDSSPDIYTKHYGYIRISYFHNMALYEIETLYQQISSLGKINLIFSKLLGRPKHQCYLRSKSVVEKLISHIESLLLFPTLFFSRWDFSNPRVPRYHGESLRSPPRKYLMQRIPEIAEVDVSDPEDLIDEGDGLPNLLVIFWAK